MKSWDIVGYTYQADNHCPDCTRLVATLRGLEAGAGPDADTDTAESALDAWAKADGVNRQDERSFDSGDFPKVIFASMVEDSNERCGTCHERLLDG